LIAIPGKSTYAIIAFLEIFSMLLDAQASRYRRQIRAPATPAPKSNGEAKKDI
jgi:hypothetical protein